MLRPLRDLFPAEGFPDLLVGLGGSDDAAVYKLTSELAIIHTVDFFTPVVDDPYTYGAIAAANAMSDIYAMGGEVLMALNVCGFPPDMAPEIITEILRGGAQKVAESGGVLAGGHTVDDPEPKYGLAVAGVVHPDMVATKAGAKPGDALVLTKRLGVGIITTAFKGGVADPDHMVGATESMLALNRKAAQLMQRVGPNAATDITGFALLGHASEMANLSGVGMRFRVSQIPFLEGALRYADEWLFPGGSTRNRDYYGCGVEFAPAVPEEVQMLLFTPETSGGLLIAVAKEKLETLTELFAAEGQPCWVVGEAVEGTGLLVEP